MKRLNIAIVSTLMFCACGGSDFTVPVECYKLDNGLKVVLAEDDTAPIVTVAVYYNIGFRNEPKDRTGFAHLFEHLMFQGSQNYAKGEFDKLTEGYGGFNNGSTRFDFTNYYEVVASHALEPVLFAEADRMGRLAVTEQNLSNQRDVVKNEVMTNVLNRPYGGFPWLEMPQRANQNWYNNHNFYGEFQHLDSANLGDVEEFYKTFYAPNNAVLVITGDFDESSARTWIRKYFEDIPSSALPPRPDLTEPRQEKAREFSRTDELINRPALGFSYHMPERRSPQYYAMAVIDQILLQGEDSRLSREVVKKHGMSGSVAGGINLLGHMFNYNGPMLWTVYLFHDEETGTDSILSVVDTQIAELQSTLVPKEEFERALTKWRSAYYGVLDYQYGVGRADLLACFALFDDDPDLINTIEEEMLKVTPQLIRETASAYLRTSNRTVVKVLPPEKK